MSQTSHSPLTARYRPQTFKQVAGQNTLKSILSRAAGLGQAAPAYLFSGTRGVGKTTVARIFAKALNCRRAPAPEPCNECDLCRAVTAGSCIDVVEIDGASNRGIDDVRKLKEVVGYAPMDGKFKIFIIDEAHMLSREAFNALLKTLEEPPAGVVFIMATTEPHKFPATIISRCQHYVFTRLSEAELQDHLANVLEHEGIGFDQSAVRLIARRGAGSVRDSMSLLGQVLALGISSVNEDAVRSVLGLAGQDAFLQLLQCFRSGDGVALVGLLQSLLEGGLDMGFFLRELAGLWRNLFLLRQNGKSAVPLLEMHEGEALILLQEAQKFSLQHIHAAWQMTLEGQRRVLTSLEPAQALELLFLNLSMLTRLLPIQAVPGGGLGVSGDGGGPGGQTPNSNDEAPGGGAQSPHGAFLRESPKTSRGADFAEQNFSHDEPAGGRSSDSSPSASSAPLTGAGLAPPSGPTGDSPFTSRAAAASTEPGCAGSFCDIGHDPEIPFDADDPGYEMEGARFDTGMGMSECAPVSEIQRPAETQILDSDSAALRLNLRAPETDPAQVSGPPRNLSDGGASASKVKLHHKLKEEIFNHAMVQQLDEVFGISLVNFGQDLSHKPRRLSAEQPAKG